MAAESNWLVHDHRRYDATLDECEIAAGAGQWQEAVELFRGLLDDLKLHMQMEEEVVYPAIVEETGDPDGAIVELREEHEDLERLLRDIGIIVRTRDYDHFLESLPPLHETMRRHNRHEEGVFLRLGPGVLRLRREEILARLRELEQQTGKRAWDF